MTERDAACGTVPAPGRSCRTVPAEGRAAAGLAWRVLLALLWASGCAATAQPLLPAGPLVVLESPESDGRLFVGSSSCRPCHPAAFDRWRATGHAREYAGLPPADRESPPCLRCHVTGYGRPLGYRRSTSLPELASVGCEACHGPGGEHARSAHPALVPIETGGECAPCETNRVCRLCHTPERSAGFDLASALERISCGAGSGAGR